MAPETESPSRSRSTQTDAATARLFHGNPMEITWAQRDIDYSHAFERYAETGDEREAVDALVEAGYERGHARWWVGKWHDQLNRR